MRRVRASVVAAGPRHLTPSSNCLLLGFRGSVVPVRHFRSAVVAPAAEEAGEGGSANVLSDNPLFASVQEIEVEGSAINKAGAIVEVIARGGGQKCASSSLFPPPDHTLCELWRVVMVMVVMVVMTTCRYGDCTGAY